MHLGVSPSILGKTFAVLTASALVVGCSRNPSPYNSRTLSYRVVPVVEYGESVVAFDLDGDGVDEIIDYDPPFRRTPRWQPVLVKTQSGVLIDQVNLAGKPLKPHSLDLDADGNPELLLPYLRNDSLFVTICDSRARKLFGFFLLRGEPVHEPDGVHPFGVQIPAFYAVDVDGDTTVELVTMVHGRRVRGVLVSSLPAGDSLGFLQVGSFLKDVHVTDTDSNGVLELIAGGWAVDNGAWGNGMDDRHSYTAVIDLELPLRLRWSRLNGGLWSKSFLAIADYTTNDGPEILSATTATLAPSESEPAKIELINAATTEVIRQRLIPDPMVWFILSDVNEDLMPEVIGLHAPNMVKVFDSDLTLVASRELHGDFSHMTLIPDVSGDGGEEIMVGYTNGGFLILDTDLRPQAFAAGQRFAGTVKRGLRRRSLLLMRDRDKLVGLEFVDNHLAWLYRVGPGLAALGIVLGFGWVAVNGGHKRRNSAVRTALAKLALEDDSRPFIIFDSKERLLAASPLFADAATGPNWSRELAHALSGHPALLDFCRRSMKAGRIEEPWDIPSEQRYLLRAHSQPVGLFQGKIHIVVAEPAHLDTFSRAWGAIAQRVAHDMMSPLNSILLYAQNLQSSGDGQDSRTMAGRIEERVEYVRRLSRNFLKVVDLEEPVRLPHDINELVEAHAARIAEDAPPDITVRADCARSIPPVDIDPEQILSVLENLTSNAVEALAGGGSIKLSTALARSLPTPDVNTGRDHVVLEVSDTGSGIEPHRLDQIFKTGFSTRGDGTGLGLAIAKKIIEDHNGHIEVVSEVGVGTVFSVYLPAYRG